MKFTYDILEVFSPHFMIPALAEKLLLALEWAF